MTEPGSAGVEPESLDPDDAKLVVLARAAMARAESDQGAAVRDLDGRTYAAGSVRLASLRLTALQASVAAAVSSGAQGCEAVALVGAGVDDAGLAAVHELSEDVVIVIAGRDGRVREVLGG